MISEPKGGEPLNPPTHAELVDRYRFGTRPLTPLSLGDVADLLVCHAAGECSEGALAEITGIDRDTLRGMLRNAISVAETLFECWREVEDERFKASRRSPPSAGSASESGTSTTTDVTGN